MSELREAGQRGWERMSNFFNESERMKITGMRRN
jgi:hypothetical protein